MFNLTYFFVLIPAFFLGRSRVFSDLNRRFFQPGMIPFSLYIISACLFVDLLHVNPWAETVLWSFYGYFGGTLATSLSILMKQHGMRKLGHPIVLMMFIFAFALPFLFLQQQGLLELQVAVSLVFVAAVFGMVRAPRQYIMTLVYFIISIFYRLNVYSLDNLPKKGGVLLLGNHVSYIDWAILQLFCPRDIRFVIHRNYYNRWYATWFFKSFDLIPIANGSSKEAIQEIGLTLQRGGVVCLFPEGRLTANGQLTMFRTGFERAVVGVDAVIVPFYLHGLWGTKLTQASTHYRQLLKTYNKRVSIVYGMPLPIDSKAYQVQQKVRELSVEAWRYSRDELTSIPSVWLTQVKRKSRAFALMDLKGRPISHERLLTSVLSLVHRLKQHTPLLGLILPTTPDAVMMNMAVLCSGLPLIHLDPEIDEAMLTEVLSASDIKTIVSTRNFIEKFKTKGLDRVFATAQVNIVALEDLISRRHFWMRLMVRCLPLWLLKRVWLSDVVPQQTALIHMRRDETGHIKTMQWSHATLLAMIHQIASVFCLNQRDIMMNVIPFHDISGLTISTLMPLVEGIPMACYPDPSNALGLARFTLVSRVTLMLASPQIFEQLLHHEQAHALMLDSLRLVLSVGSRIPEAVREQFRVKFHLAIHEGYGVAELAPMVSCNLPDVICTQDWNVHRAHKPGTMGLPLPGYAFRVVEPVCYEDVPVGDVGLVLIGAMSTQENAASLDKEYLWHVTSIEGFLDKEGYLSIVSEL